MRIAIINYNMGNLASVKNALDLLGYDAFITSDKDEILKADKAILPGVGAFKDAMKELEKLDLISTIKEFVRSNKPILGICLGMQLMFDSSVEFGYSKGLGLIPGDIVKFEIDLKVPHMGWNNLEIKEDSKLFKGLDNPYVYFVHSFYLPVSKYATAITNYGIDFSASVEYNNIYACQFHPEKSGDVGLKILKNFGDL